MAGFIHCVQFRTPTYLTSGGGAADASFPHSNAGQLMHPHRPWKSSANVVSGTTFYGVDFGAAVTLGAIAIDNINISSVIIQAASNSAFSTGTINVSSPVATTITANQVERGLFADSAGASLGRYKYFFNCATEVGGAFNGVSRQYWRILANTSTPITGSAAKMWLGTAAWCTTLTTWSAGTTSYDELPLEATRPNDDFAGGGAEPVILGNPYAAVTLGATPAARSTMRTPMLELLRMGIGRPFLFYRNAGDTADFYLCQRAGDVTLRTTFASAIEVNNFIMRSAV